ncbi:MAG TPA: hypothetical protein PLT92_02435 [Ignavibacteriaceae bacterium]|nr:hypothetical protein [Ignavibacteriaceae bacterium]HPO56391.1 hypothetical protein [Ignavibacteriaceae bacterium]
MIRVISIVLWGIVIFFLIKFVRTIIKGYKSISQKESNIRNYKMKQTDYKDIQDADYTEIRESDKNRQEK